MQQGKSDKQSEIEGVSEVSHGIIPLSSLDEAPLSTQKSQKPPGKPNYTMIPITTWQS